MNVRSFSLLLALLLGATGCTGHNPNASATEGSTGSSGDTEDHQVDTEDVSGGTSPDTETSGGDSASGTTGTDSASTNTSTSTTTTGAPDETTGGNTTGWVGGCMDGCEDYVTRAQMAADLETSCEKLFSDILCEDDSQDDYVLRAEAIKVAYQHLLDQGKFPEDCMGTIPAHLDVSKGAWFYSSIWKLYCAEILFDDGQQCSTNFCPGSPACQDWWKDIHTKVMAL